VRSEWWAGKHASTLPFVSPAVTSPRHFHHIPQSRRARAADADFAPKG
jgi:hypothetical protein